MGGVLLLEPHDQFGIEAWTSQQQLQINRMESRF